MPDEMDRIQDNEAEFALAAAHGAMGHAEDTPNVGCAACDCSTVKWKDCEFYVECLKDWEKRRKAAHIGGHNDY